MLAEQLVSKYRTFIEKYYYNELLNNIKKGLTALYIDFGALAKFDLELSEQLLSSFDEAIENFEEAIKSLDIPEAKYPIRIRVLNLPKSSFVKIRDIRSKHLSQVIATEGLVRQASDIRPKITLATFECPNCGAQMLMEQTGAKFREPLKCNCGRSGKFKQLSKKLIDMQRLIVEEAPENLEGGEQPKRIQVFLEEDLLEPKLEKKHYPGNKVIIIGVVKEIPTLLKTGGISTTYELSIDTNSVDTIEEEFEEIELKPEDEHEIKDLASKPNIYERLAKSIAPSIYGHENIKEAIVLQLFSGVRKVREDGTKTRGDIHIFLVGDPGSGKSELLKYVATLAPKSRYISGKGASAAGITASVVRDEFIRGWALEAGALVLANKGIACIDELDKMTPEDTSAMHEACEQQTITIAKANIHATLRAETSILAAANPKYGRFNPYDPIAKQLDLPPTLLNRFDLIFPIRDIPNLERDERIAQHILELAQDPNAKKPEISSELLRKFIAYAKQRCVPKLTTGAIEEIKQFYITLRAGAAKEEGEIKAIPISARQLEALVRLSEASAKLRLADRVTRSDAQRAIRLLKSSMEEVAFDIETGRFDIDRVTTGITAVQRSQIASMRRILDMLTEKIGKAIPLQDIIKETEAEGIDRAKVEEILENLKKKGDIMEPRPGLITKVN
jgi:replicative DNA helicase Mcm